METTVATGIEYTYVKSEINEMIHKTLDKINDVVKENNYQVNGNIEECYDLVWKNPSKNQMKNIQKYCYWVDKHPSLKKINTFFSLLTKCFGIKRIHVKVSAKEEAIQNARKKMLVAKNLYENLLMEYKTEKGNFYK